MFANICRALSCSSFIVIYRIFVPLEPFGPNPHWLVSSLRLSPRYRHPIKWNGHSVRRPLIPSLRPHARTGVVDITPSGDGHCHSDTGDYIHHRSPYYSYIRSSGMAVHTRLIHLPPQPPCPSFEVNTYRTACMVSPSFDRSTSFRTLGLDASWQDDSAPVLPVIQYAPSRVIDDDRRRLSGEHRRGHKQLSYCQSLRSDASRLTLELL